MADVPSLSARVIAGPEIRLVNISRRGVLLETSSRLLPDAVLRIRFQTGDDVLISTGAVVRSTVSTVNGEGLRYHTAVALVEPITLYDDSFWETGSGAGAARSDPQAHLVIVTCDHSRDQLEQLLSGNDW
jgi:hypothetical protein